MKIIIRLLIILLTLVNINAYVNAEWNKEKVEFIWMPQNYSKHFIAFWDNKYNFKNSYELPTKIEWKWCEVLSNLKVDYNELNILNVKLHLNSKYKNIVLKIDKALEKINWYKLEKLSCKLQKLKYKKLADKKVDIKDIVNYIYYKTIKQYNEIYNSNISESLKKDVSNINKNSFTKKEVKNKLILLLNKYKNNNADIEYIKILIKNSEVWILLNHQNFEEGKKIISIYKNTNLKLKFFARNADYYSFYSFYSNFSFNFKKEWNLLLKYRYEYFPDEKKSWFILNTVYSFNNIDCSKLKIFDANIDLIKIKFCKLYNNKFDKSDLFDFKNLNNNLQNISNNINYIWAVARMWLYNLDYIYKKQKEHWEQIIETDKNFINWYYALLSFYDYKKDCKNYKKYLELMKKNYIWDEKRRPYVFWIKYKNCSIY